MIMHLTLGTMTAGVSSSGSGCRSSREPLRWCSRLRSNWQ